MPNSNEEWRTIAQGFMDKWDFSHCIGIVEGRHIRIVLPPGNEPLFYNYKKFHSLLLIVCVNADYEFIWVEVGINGMVSDSSALKYTQFYESLRNYALNLAPPQPLSIDSTPTPYVFIIDENFESADESMKPFNQETLTNEQIIFNDPLMKAISVVENMFNILANRFRILQTTINLSLDQTDLIVLTCSILHIFFKKTCSAYTVEKIIPEGEVNQVSVGDPLTPLQNTVIENLSDTEQHIRETFKEYFVGERRLPKQELNV